MAKFKVYAGLGGGFGGATYRGIEEHENIEQATISAFFQAKEEYASYDGLHGLRTMEEIMEEDGIDDPMVGQAAYGEEVESWIDYYAKEV